MLHLPCFKPFTAKCYAAILNARRISALIGREQVKYLETDVKYVHIILMHITSVFFLPVALITSTASGPRFNLMGCLSRRRHGQSVS